MAFNRDIRDVNVGSAGSPVAPVQKQVASRAGEAQAIRDLGRTVAEGVVEGQKVYDQSLVNDYQSQVQSNLDEFITSQDDLTEEDKKNIKSFDDLVARYSADGRSSDQIKQFRLRMAAELKRAVNDQPHLEDRYRSAAGKVLGFDPGQERFRQMQQEAAEGDRLLQMQMDMVLRDVASKGFDMTKFQDDPQMQADYAWIKEQERKAAMIKAAAVDGQVPEVTYMSNLPTLINDNMQKQNQNFATNIRQRAAGFGIELPENITLATQITGDLRNQIVNNAPLRQALLSDIEQTKVVLEAQVRAETANFTDKNSRDAAVKLQLANLDLLSGMLDPQKNAQDIEASVRLMKNTAQANILQDHRSVLTMGAIQDAFGVAALPDSAKAQAFTALAPLYADLVRGVKLGADNTLQVTENPGDIDTSMMSTIPAADAQPIVDHFAKILNSDTEDATLISAYLNRYAQVFASPDTARNQKVMESFFKMMSNDVNKAGVVEFMDKNPELGRNITKAYTGYSRNAAGEISRQVTAMISDYRDMFGTRTTAFGQGSPVMVQYKDGKMQLALDEKGLTRWRNSYTGKNGDEVLALFRRDAESKLSRWNAQYMNKLNAYNNVYSEIIADDVPRESMYYGTPFESFVTSGGIRGGVIEFDEQGQLVKVE